MGSPNLTLAQRVQLTLCTPIVWVLYLLVLFLMRVAPDAREFREHKALEFERGLRMPTFAAQRVNPLVWLSVYLYRHSWVRIHMHRNGLRCCFVPTCSEYALIAVQRYGLWRGLMLIGDRFRRCTPLSDEGYVDFP